MGREREGRSNGCYTDLLTRYGNAFASLYRCLCGKPLACHSKSSTWTKTLATKLPLRSCDSPAVRRAALLLSQTLVITRTCWQHLRRGVSICCPLNFSLFLLVSSCSPACLSVFLPARSAICPSLRLPMSLSEETGICCALDAAVPLGLFTSLTSKTSVFNQICTNMLVYQADQ